MNNFEQQLFDCGKVNASFDESKVCGDLTIESLLRQPFEKHIASFEIPVALRDIFDVDHVNAIITWYINWKITESIENQNTCTIMYRFGQKDGLKVIIAINLYKYLRHKSYDPDIVEKFINQ